MTLEEKLALIRGKQPFHLPATERPPQLVFGRRLRGRDPSLRNSYLAESDANLGVANQGGMMRSKDVATALPSGGGHGGDLGRGTVERGGAAIGAEARAKGFNVLLAGGMNLVGEPRCGRTFESDS